MPSYEVKGVNDGEIVVVATVDTATDALTKCSDAEQVYRRVWVTDETGKDVSVEQLLARSEEEVGRA
jgi:hypothetical protein